MKLKLLIIDDDPTISEAIKLIIEGPWEITYCDNPFKIPSGFFHLAFIDCHFKKTNDLDGLKAMQSVSKNSNITEIIAISGDLSRELMEACLKAGAKRFLSKPLEKDEILLILSKVEAYFILISNQMKNQNINWIGNSQSSMNIKREIANLKGEKGPILISGETGTGKEVAASLIHNQELESPLVSINIAAIPESLFESELFGHIKGSFTGADQNKMGLCEAAHGGDLFLDEIEALTTPMQVKLLRFLESGEIRRVGSNKSTHVDVRVICATNEDLNKLVQEKKFRQDLLFRLSGKKIDLPPLRERPLDIPDLCNFFLLNMKPKRNKTFSEGAISELQSYYWPGNIRELKRLVEQISIISPLPIIRTDDVKNILGAVKNNITQNDESMDLTQGLDNLVQSYERQVIFKALQIHKQIDEVAKVLAISRSSLYKKIKDYNISIEDN